jgi:hypothetical protein
MDPGDFLALTGWGAYESGLLYESEAYGSGFWHEVNRTGNTHRLSLADVDTITHWVEGENDELDWIVVGRTTDGRWFHASAGCDFTGWDCQANGMVEFHDSLAAVFAPLNMTDSTRERLHAAMVARQAPQGP